MRTPTAQAPRRGLAAVEFAVALPLLLTLILGIWEVSRIVEVHHVLSNAAREAGRRIPAGTVDEAAITQSVKDYLGAAGIRTERVEVTVADQDNPDAKYVEPARHKRIRIDVAIPFADVCHVNLFLVSGPGDKVKGEALWTILRQHD
jgi:hypothetical protein